MKFQALVCLAFMAVGTIAVAVSPIFERDDCLETYTGQCDPQSCAQYYCGGATARCYGLCCRC